MPGNMTTQPNIFTRIFLTPAEPRLRAGWRILIMTILMIGLLILMSPLVILTLFIDLDADMLLFISALMAAVSYTGAVLITRIFIDRRTIKSLGLPLGRKAIWDILVGICLAAGLMLFTFLVMLAAGWLEWNGTSFENLPVNEIIIKIVLAALTFFLVGWGEELIMRGYLLVNIRDGINLFWAVCFSSVIFAFAHGINPGFSFSALVGLFLAGLFFAFAALRSKGLWLPIGIHIGWNFFEGTFFGFSVSGMETFRLFKPVIVGSDLWTGGSFGPEAGLILIPTLLIGTALVYLYTRKRIHE